MEAIKTAYQMNIRDDGSFVFHHPPKFLWGEDWTASNWWKTYSVYLHVPFCRAICTFCTFERKQLRRGSLDWFTDLLSTEMDIILEKDDFSQAYIESVYLGGGTASLLSNDAVRTFLFRLRNEFGLTNNKVEVTLECEPGTKKENDFRELREAGINRISIGVQTFSDQILRSLNRHHNSSQSLQMMEAVRNARIDNLHVDLMYGLPGQTFDDWKKAIDRVAREGVDHISTYPLIVFENQLLNRTINKGLLPRQGSSEECEEMQQYALETLLTAGYERYSLIEYARPGRECRYVTATWDGSDYLGMGPGAYSRNHFSLWEDTVFHNQYDAMIANGIRPVGKGLTMTPRQALARDIAMGLCMLSVDIPTLEKKCGIGVFDNFAGEIESLVEEGLLNVTADEISLTETGIRYATHVMKCFTISF